MEIVEPGKKSPAELKEVARNVALIDFSGRRGESAKEGERKAVGARPLHNSAFSGAAIPPGRSSLRNGLTRSLGRHALRPSKYEYTTGVMRSVSRRHRICPPMIVTA